MNQDSEAAGNITPPIRRPLDGSPTATDAASACGGPRASTTATEATVAAIDAKRRTTTGWHGGSRCAGWRAAGGRPARPTDP